MIQQAPTQLIRQHRLVPVVSEADPDKAMRLADALVAGGLPILELTLRDPRASEALGRIAQRGDVLTIAGTVLTAEQVDQMADLGAKMIVSPGLSDGVIERAKLRDLPVCPGVCTPTDVQRAVASDVTLLKFFPASAAGGPPMLKALSAPFPMVQFMPTGGISEANLADYLSVPSVVACGGSWMVSPKLYAEGQFDRVEEAVRQAVTLVATLSN